MPEWLSDMLQHLHIQNFALISQLDIDFQQGFSVLTGETGAGKSIILGALALLMGERADSRAITEGEQKCVIEGEFDVTNVHLESFFDENDIDYQPICTIRRELLASGKSRSFVNDTPVTLVPLRELSSRLIDIHSQHENLLLDKESFQLEVVDSVADNGSIINSYQAAYQAYKATEKALAMLREHAQKATEEQDYLAYQFQLLDEAQLQADELDELEQEEQQLTHAEEIQIAYATISNALDSEQGALQAMHVAMQQNSHICSFVEDKEHFGERLQSAYLELKDIAEMAMAYAERIEVDPARLNWVTERIDTLRNLLQKYHLNTIAELISLRDEMDEKLQHIAEFDEEISAYEKSLHEKKQTLIDVAAQLTASRQAVLNPIREQLETSLKQLGIQHASIEVRLNEQEEFTHMGKEAVEIYFAANKNQQLRPVKEIASGGEIARIMLCIKALMANNHALPTIIFDEVDTGVSGAVAEKMGEIMRQISLERQVIAITHLPQIAAKAQKQYRVFKQDTELRTETNIVALAEDERVIEVARLLSGDKITDAALDNARQLMQ